MASPKITDVWKKVYSQPFYAIIIILVAFVFYELNVIIQSLGNLSTFTEYGFKSFLSYFLTISLKFSHTVKFSSYITLILLSILSGILVSLMIFKIKNSKIKTKTGFLGTLGLLIAFLAPGCAACGLGIIAALGLGSIAITFLPLEGIEISIIAIIILAFAIFKISKDLTICKVCQINFQKMKGGKI